MSACIKRLAAVRLTSTLWAAAAVLCGRYAALWDNETRIKYCHEQTIFALWPTEPPGVVRLYISARH